VPLFGHPVVRRNTLKRRIREILRREVLPTVSGRIDIVVRARRRAYQAGFAVLKQELDSLARYAREPGGRSER
jgi:ribonuclease P protein component